MFPIKLDMSRNTLLDANYYEYIPVAPIIYYFITFTLVLIDFLYFFSTLRSKIKGFSLNKDLFLFCNEPFQEMFELTI